MDSEELEWYIGLSVVIGLGIALIVVLQIIHIYNEPHRKELRKRKAFEKHEEKCVCAINSVNLNGLKLVEISLNYRKRDIEFLYSEYRALLKRGLIKTKFVTPNILKYKNLSEKYVPYESNRVKLMSNIDDYINASWIDGYNYPKKYIACQAPLYGTISDFWHMLWENDSNIIVMIGEDILHKDVFNYLDFSKRDAQKQLPFNMQIVKTYKYQEYILRIIKLSYRPEERMIYHLQMISWSLQHIPPPQIILECRRTMQLLWLKNGGPIIVHCINGCGRTGTFIAIANLCDQIDTAKQRREDQTISWPYEAMRIRESRTNSIVNIFQYQALYECVCHYVVSGVTVISAQNLHRTVCYLTEKLSDGKTRFQRQYEDTIKMTKPLTKSSCLGGIRTENLHTNRDLNIIPRDLDRPYLKKVYYNNDSDYINGIYVDNFNSRNHFIVTQWPLVSTINKIWRLIYEKDIKVVIILNAIDNENYPQFWTNILNQKFGFEKISVELKKDWFYNNSIRCQLFVVDQAKFHMNESDKKKLLQLHIQIRGKMEQQPAKSVIFIHMLGWSEIKAIPSSLKDFIELIWFAKFANGAVNGTKSPILIISRDGYHRAGVFCAASLCLERIRQCDEVDVYNAVLSVKRNRPELVANFEEYKLIYELCVEYLSWSEADNAEIRNEQINFMNS